MSIPNIHASNRRELIEVTGVGLRVAEVGVVIVFGLLACPPTLLIAVAVGDDLLIAEPRHALHGVRLAMVLGGPALYLVSGSLFRLRVAGAANATRLAVAAILVLLAPVGSQISALALSATVAALLGALAPWELLTPARCSLGTRLGTPTDAPGGLMGDRRHLQQQPEGTT